MIKEQELKKLQRLARINLSQKELNSFKKKINSVIIMVSSLFQVNCDKVEPLRSVIDLKQRTRKDKVTIKNITDQLFSNVPLKNSGFTKETNYFIVPKIID